MEVPRVPRVHWAPFEDNIKGQLAKLFALLNLMSLLYYSAHSCPGLIAKSRQTSFIVHKTTVERKPSLGRSRLESPFCVMFSPLSLSQKAEMLAWPFTPSRLTIYRERERERERDPVRKASWGPSKNHLVPWGKREKSPSFLLYPEEKASLSLWPDKTQQRRKKTPSFSLQFETRLPLSSS